MIYLWDNAAGMRPRWIWCVWLTPSGGAYSRGTVTVISAEDETVQPVQRGDTRYVWSPQAFWSRLWALNSRFSVARALVCF
jgi:hypothetical protein